MEPALERLVPYLGDGVVLFVEPLLVVVYLDGLEVRRQVLDKGPAASPEGRGGVRDEAVRDRYLVPLEHLFAWLVAENRDRGELPHHGR